MFSQPESLVWKVKIASGANKSFLALLEIWKCIFFFQRMPDSECNNVCRLSRASRSRRHLLYAEDAEGQKQIQRQVTLSQHGPRAKQQPRLLE